MDNQSIKQAIPGIWPPVTPEFVGREYDAYLTQITKENIMLRAYIGQLEAEKAESEERVRQESESK